MRAAVQLSVVALLLRGMLTVEWTVAVATVLSMTVCGVIVTCLLGRTPFVTPRAQDADRA